MTLLSIFDAPVPKTYIIKLYFWHTAFELSTSGNQLLKLSTMVVSTPDIVGPFTDIVQQTSIFIWDITANNVPRDLHWDRLLITFFLAICLFVFYRGNGSKNGKGEVRKTGFLEYLLPKDIYTQTTVYRFSTK